MAQGRRRMTPIQLVVYPALKAASALGNLVTYEDVPLATKERADSCPYLGHVPFFAPRLNDEQSKK